MFRSWMISIVLAAVCSAAVFSESISGKLVDPKGTPVPGARLWLLQNNKRVATTSTDRHGEFAFLNLKGGSYIVTAHERGFAQQAVEVELGPGQDLRRDVILDLETLHEQVVVTATRTEAPKSLIGAGVTVITAEEIEAQNATNVAEVLRNVPGVNILQIGGRGSLTTLFVRGGESDYNKVLLDGIPLNQPGGAIDLSNLSTANIERIEMVRGPQSALYGSDAITSVIQIFTKRGRPETAVPKVSLFSEGGTYDSFRSGASLSGGAGPIAYSAAFQHLSTDNRDPNDFFHNNSFSSRIDLQTSSKSSLSFVMRAERGRSGVPGPTAFGPPDLEEFYRKRDLIAGLTWDHQISEIWRHKISYSQSYVNQLSADPFVTEPSPFFPEFRGKRAAFPSFDFPFSFLNATRRHNVNYQSDFILSTHVISAGMDYEEERGVVGEFRDPQGILRPVTAGRTNLGYYFQDQFLVGNRLALTGGLRLEDNGSFGFAAVPRISLAYLLRTGGAGEFWGMTKPKLNFGLGIKEPNFVESFSPNFFFKGNPGLEPEKTRSIEVGVEQALAQNRLRAEVSFFHNRFDDLIAFQIVDFNTFEGSFSNLDESRSWGFENIVEAALGESLRVSVGYTYLNTALTSAPRDPAGGRRPRLLLRPAHSGFVGLTFSSGRWKLNTNSTFIGERPDSDFRGIGLTQVDGYTKWDLSGSYRIHPHLELHATFDNLLNQDYFEEIGFPALKFHFRSGVNFKF